MHALYIKDLKMITSRRSAIPMFRRNLQRIVLNGYRSEPPASVVGVSKLKFSSHFTNQTENSVWKGTKKVPHSYHEIGKIKVPECRFHRCQHKLATMKSEGDDLSPSTSSPPSPKPTPTTPIVPSTQYPDRPPSQPPMPPRKRPGKKMSNFMFTKFLSFVQQYQEMMEKKFPQAMQVYRVFVVGFKDFSKEMAEYVKIKTKALLSADGPISLSGKDLDVYYRMPREMFRVGPTLLMSALPGFQYIVFPIAYKFPKTLLSSHFWSLQQKSQFAIEIQKKRLLNQRPVLRHLQSRMDSITNRRHVEIFKEIMLKIGSGSQPSIREIMSVKPLFESDPFSIKAVHGPHIKSLCRLHGLHAWFFNRRRLFDRAEMLCIMDSCLIREGIFNLKTEELKSACFLRGFNAANTSHEDMVEFLQQWVSVSSTIQPHSYSLLLHLPILIAYNNPNNWALLYQQ